MYRQDFGHKEAPYERVRPKHAFQPNNAPFDGGYVLRQAGGQGDAAARAGPSSAGCMK
jgi:hypothetical protein